MLCWAAINFCYWTQFDRLRPVCVVCEQCLHNRNEDKYIWCNWFKDKIHLILCTYLALWTTVLCYKIISKQNKLLRRLHYKKDKLKLKETNTVYFSLVLSSHLVNGIHKYSPTGKCLFCKLLFPFSLNFLFENFYIIVCFGNSLTTDQTRSNKVLPDKKTSLPDNFWWFLSL